MRTLALYIDRNSIREMRDVQQDYEFYPEICERYETILSSVEDPDTSETGVSPLTVDVE